MATKLLENLLFQQGGRCFFCDGPLAKEEASVEHLQAKANKGDSSDGNCVACCKQVNQLLGSKSLVEKFRIVLKQNGRFICPMIPHVDSTKKTQSALPQTLEKQIADKKPPKKGKTLDTASVLTRLKSSGAKAPKTLKTLKGLIKSLLQPNEPTTEQLEQWVKKLEKSGKVVIEGNDVTYKL